MATPAQLDANRLNSQNSTGPRTAEGKAVSAANSLKHGLYSRSAVIPGEDQAAYEEHAASYRNRFRPSTPEEEFQVEVLIDESWKRRRYSNIETALMARIITEAGPSENPLGVIFSSANPDSRLLDRVIRAREASTRAWDRAFARLQALIAARPAAPRPAVAERTQSAPARPPATPAERTQSPVPFHLRNVSQEITPDMSKEERERILALRL